MATKLPERQVRLIVLALQKVETHSPEEESDRVALLTQIHRVDTQAVETQVATLKGTISGAWSSWKFDSTKLPAGSFNIRPTDGTIGPMNPGKDSRVAGSGSLGVYSVDDQTVETFATITVS